MMSGFKLSGALLGGRLSGLLSTVRRSAVVAPAVAAFAVVPMLAGCGGSPKRPLRAADVPVAPRDLPEILRGTLAGEGTIRGLEPTLVSGYGLVVRLNGTGSGDVPESVRAMLEQEMARLGVGSENAGPYADLTPSTLIDDPNTSVVFVQALIPIGAPEGTTFDVRVNALRGSSTTSLEGGLLYTTDLRRGIAKPSGPDIPRVATAYGEVHVNPYATSDEQITRNLTQGMVLGGGTVLRTNPLQIELDNPSHSRAREVARAINTKFSRSRNDRLQTAIGRNDEIIQINVPKSWSDRSDEFTKLVLYTRVDQAFAPEWAERYATALVERPDLSEELIWCMRALGEVSIGFVRPLYDHPELAPRNAAIGIGAWLGDPLTLGPIEKIVSEGPISVRANAVRLAARLPYDARVERFMRKMLNNEDIAVRIAAYESLVELGSSTVLMQSMGEKYSMHLVPSDYPMVFITQDQTPVIALFGKALSLETPLFFKGQNDRLIVETQNTGPSVRVFYRDSLTGTSVQRRIDSDLGSVLRFFSGKPRPDDLSAGLDMTYTEVVGALYELSEAGAYKAQFYTQADEQELALLRQLTQEFEPDRPELSSSGELDELPPLDDIVADAEDDDEEEGQGKSLVVPLTPPAPKSDPQG